MIETWTTVKIEEIAEINPRVPRDALTGEMPVSFVPMASVGAADGSIDVSVTRPYSAVQKGFTTFKEGDVLFAKITPCMENGKMAIVPKVINGFGFGSTEFHVLRPHTGIEASYLYHYVSGKSFRQEAEHNMAGAVGQRRVPTPYLAASEIPIPPNNEQKRIVAKLEELLSELDKGIESFKTAREQLKVYRQALLKHAFEGKLTAKWREENKDKLESADVLLKRIQAERAERYRQQVKEWEKAVKLWEKGGTKGSKPSKPSKPKELAPLTSEELAELPELPKGWGWEKNENYLFEVKDGTHDTPKYLERGIPFVTQKNIRNDKLDMRDVSYISSEDHENFFKRSNVQKGDLIVSMIGHGRGQCCLIDSDVVFSIKNVGLFKFFSKLQSNRFLTYYYQSTGGLNLVLNKSKGGAQPFIGLTELRAWPVSVCSLDEQNMIVQELDSRLSEVDQLDQTITTALQQAETLRQSILKKAFSGQLVPQNPSDEPASILLARIKAERDKLNIGDKGKKRAITRKKKTDKV